MAQAHTNKQQRTGFFVGNQPVDKTTFFSKLKEVVMNQESRSTAETPKPATQQQHHTQQPQKQKPTLPKKPAQTVEEIRLGIADQDKAVAFIKTFAGVDVTQIAKNNHHVFEARCTAVQALTAVKTLCQTLEVKPVRVEIENEAQLMHSWNLGEGRYVHVIEIDGTFKIVLRNRPPQDCK